MLRRWTTEEDRALRAHYPLKGAKWCANHLARSSIAVMNRASKLDLCLDQVNSTHRKLTADQEREVASLYVEEAKSAREIGEIFQVKPGCVYAILGRKGISRDRTGSRNRRWTNAEEAAMVERYLAGESLTDLAFALETSASAIQVILARHAVKRRSCGTGGAHKYTYTDRRGRELKMRSGWEVLVAFHLDAQNLDWNYEEKSYTLSIRDKRGNPCSYTPDFWVYAHDGRLDALIDVKGRRTAKQDRRIQALQDDYPGLPFSIWDEAKIRMLGFTGRVLRHPQLVVGERLVRRA